MCCTFVLFVLNRVFQFLSGCSFLSIPYTEGENFRAFCSFVAINESFLREICGCSILWCDKSKQSPKVFPIKVVFFTNSRNFSHFSLRVLFSAKGENFCEFRCFVAICKSFLCENWGCRILWHGKSEQSVKVLSLKIIFFTNSRKFFPSKLSCYMVLGLY